MAQLAKLWEQGANQGFLVPPLVRFVSGDQGYLDMTNGGPRMFINLEDHISHTTKKPNLPFEVAGPAHPRACCSPDRRVLSSSRACMHRQ